ncbi:MAG: thioredoxin [Syntrophomonadaceae bacterium]|nr:thioredoxin [Syntrophomonadaceae bacterium]
MAEVSRFEDNNFDREVLQTSEAVLVDFWAPWCGPCRMVGPVVEEIAEEYAGRLKVGKVNVDENRDLATRYGIMSIPTLIVFKNGKEIQRIVGYRGKQGIVEVINEVI